MTTSFISHRALDGSRYFAVLSLNVLRSLNAEKADALRAMGIQSLSDLLHYDPIHRARLIMAVARREIAHDMDLRPLLQDSEAQTLSDLAKAPVETIDGIGTSIGATLRTVFGVTTVTQLAEFAPFVEAESLMRSQAEVFSEAASAPDELIPRPIGAIASRMRYSSFVHKRNLHTRGFRFAPIATLPDYFNDTDKLLLNTVISTQEARSFELGLGFIVQHTQRWTNFGTALGEVIHSLALAAGESRNVAIIDWKRNLVAQRRENTTASEQLNSLLVHTRALDEVTRATAEEHQTGRTATASATGVTAGGAVGAGSLVGAIGGAIVGGTTGLAVDALVLGSDLGIGTISGTILGSMAGSAVGAAAVGAAGSLIFSNAGALGFIQSDTAGDRDIIGILNQNITDMTAQKSSSIRSLRSTIVLEETQSESQQVTTFNITNYNHMHALNIEYYEILQRYQVQITADLVEPLLFYPYSPLTFTERLILDHWEMLKPGIRNKRLVDGIEQIIGQDNTLTLPDEPISKLADIRLKRIRIRVDTAFVIGIGMEVFLETENSKFSLREATEEVRLQLNPYRLQNVWVKTFDSGDGPLLSNITGIIVKYPGIQSGGKSKIRTLEVKYEARETQDGDLVHADKIPNVDLGPKTIVAGAGDIQVTFSYKPQAELEIAETTERNADSLLRELVRYVNVRRYFFTRMLLSGIEPEQFVDLIEHIVITQEQGSALDIPLRLLIDPLPLGFTSGAIVFRLRIDPIVQNLLDKVPGSRLPGFLDEIAEFPAQLQDDFAKNRARFTVTDELYLPTSGVFAEAILGRSNAAEKLDGTRFFNWQDSPIPNAAPAIQPVDTGSRAQPTQQLNPTIAGAILSLLPPTALPDPNGLAAVLQAIQNGDIFRDLSQARVLGDTLNTLAGVAERTSIAAGQLSGDALSEALKSSTDLANTVAKGVNDLAASLLKSKPSDTTNNGAGNDGGNDGGDDNQGGNGDGNDSSDDNQSGNGDGSDNNSNTSSPLDVLIRLRIFVPSELWSLEPIEFDASDILEMLAQPFGVVDPRRILSLIDFRGDGREEFSPTLGSSQIEMPISFKLDPTTLKITDFSTADAHFGRGECYLFTDAEHVVGKPNWFDRKASAEASPIASLIKRLQVSDENLKAAPLIGGDSSTVEIRVAAAPHFPFTSDIINEIPDAEVSIGEISIPVSTIANALSRFVINTIDAFITIKFFRENGEIKYIASGRHDGFPAYELYVNNDPAHRYKPTQDDDQKRLLNDLSETIPEIKRKLKRLSN